MKKESFDIMKWKELIMLLVGLVATSAVALYRLDQCEKHLDKRDKWGMKIESEVSDLRVQCARLTR